MVPVNTYKPGQPIISLGDHGNLILPVEANGNWYYAWDRNGDGGHGRGDAVSMKTLEQLASIKFTTNERDFMLNGVRLRLPTVGRAVRGEKSGHTDLLGIWEKISGDGTGTSGSPAGWAPFLYLAANPSKSGHSQVYIHRGYVYDNEDTKSFYAAFQVLAQELP